MDHRARNAPAAAARPLRSSARILRVAVLLATCVTGIASIPVLAATESPRVLLSSPESIVPGEMRGEVVTGARKGDRIKLLARVDGPAGCCTIALRRATLVRFESDGSVRYRWPRRAPTARGTRPWRDLERVRLIGCVLAKRGATICGRPTTAYMWLPPAPPRSGGCRAGALPSSAHEGIIAAWNARRGVAGDVVDYVRLYGVCHGVEYARTNVYSTRAVSSEDEGARYQAGPDVFIRRPGASWLDLGDTGGAMPCGRRGYPVALARLWRLRCDILVAP